MTVLQTQESKFEPWRSEAEHATSRSRRLPTILTFTRGWGRNIFVSFKPPRPGTEPRTLAWKAAGLTTTLGPCLSVHSSDYLKRNKRICMKQVCLGIRNNLLDFGGDPDCDPNSGFGLRSDPNRTDVYETFIKMCLGPRNYTVIFGVDPDYDN